MQKAIIETLQRAHWERGTVVLDEEEFRGSVSSLVVSTEPFDEILVNWNGRTPGESTLKVEVQILVEGQWTEFYPIAVWNETFGGSSLGWEDQWARTEVDLVKVKDGHRATGYRWRVQLRRTEFDSQVCLHDIFVSTRDRQQYNMVMSHEIAATILDVPCRSQMIQHKSYANLICSPTCLGMVAKYHGVDIATQKMIWMAYDRNSGIFGNWLMNTAVLGSLGFEAKAIYCQDLYEILKEIEAGRPVICSIRYQEGALPNAAIPKTGGHLITIVGYKPGYVVVNDPAAASVAEVRREYPVEPFLKACSGVFYLCQPRGVGERDGAHAG